MSAWASRLLRSPRIGVAADPPARSGGLGRALVALTLALICVMSAVALHDGAAGNRQGVNSVGRGAATGDDLTAVHVATQPAGSPVSGAAALAELRSLPLAGQAVISSSIGAREPIFAARRAAGGGYRLSGGGVSARLGTHRVMLGGGAASLSLTSLAVGRGTALRAAGGGTFSASANRVSYRGRNVTTWYAAGPLGIEQGFTVAQRPAGAAGELTLALGLSGALRVRQSRTGLEFMTSSGRVALRYGGLAAVDAHGRSLHATLGLDDGRIVVRVRDAGAAYPLRIDPVIEVSGKIAPSDEDGQGRIGWDVAVSADGKTALLGAPNDTNDLGAAWVYTESGGTWSEQAKLVAPTSGPDVEVASCVGMGCYPESAFGQSVALSADGNTALIGGPADGLDGNDGAAWIYTRSGSTWSEQTKLIGPTSGPDTEIEPGGYFGDSVALSSAGTTALIGGMDDDGDVGAAWIYTGSGASWSERAKLLAPTSGGDSESGKGQFGSSVSLSGAGTTALIGAPSDHSDVGAAWVFTGSGTSWSEQTRLLAPTSGADAESGDAIFGSSVALSGDASTALIGGPSDASGVGAVWAYTGSGASWSEQAKITGPTSGEDAESAPFEYGYFGTSVALSNDGTVALIGAPGDTYVGAAWLYAGSGSGWSEQTKLVAPTSGGDAESGDGGFGDSVALSSDGSGSLIGGNSDNGHLGAVWASPPATTWNVTTTADGNDGACTPSLCTLRDAIAAAHNGDIVDVPGNASDYTLTLGNLTVSTNITITGDGARDTVISGGGNSRVFLVTASGAVTLSELRITDGNGEGSENNGVGGGIYQASGDLTLENVRVDHNIASASGGGLDTNGAALTVDGSTFDDNTASSAGLIGGGIDTQFGPAPTIVNTTIADNVTGGTGGGIALPGGGTPLLINDTIVGNTAGHGAGGIDHGGATFDAVNTIVALNTVSGVEADCASMPGGDAGNNISGDSSCDFTASGDQENVTNPLLGALADNGGETDTIALLAGSPAIDAGSTAECPSRDQRGFLRPNSGETPGSDCDIGAFEYGPEGPVVSTGSASNVDSNDETVHGSVNPYGVSTTYYFAYATDAYYAVHDDYNEETTATSAGDGTSAESESAEISSLSAGTEYDFQIVASSAAGTSLGANESFMTAGGSPPAGPDLALSVSHADPFTAGGTGVYHVHITNNGSGPTTGAVGLTATAPSGITFTGATGTDWACSSSGPSVACSYTGAAIAQSGTANFDLDVAIASDSTGGSADFQLSDVGDSDSSDKSASDATTVAAAPAPDLALSVSHADPFTAGGTGTYDVHVTNNGSGPTTGAVGLTVTLPAGITATGNTGANWACTPSGQSASCSYTGAAIATSANANLDLDVAIASNSTGGSADFQLSDAGDSDSSDKSASDATTVAAPPAPDLALSVSHADPFTAGATGVYHVHITNNGSGPTTGAVGLTATAPSGITFTGATGTDWACSSSGPSVSCSYTGAAIAQGGTANFDLDVAIASDSTGGPADFQLTDAGDSDSLDKSASDATTVTTAAPVPTPTPGSGSGSGSGPAPAPATGSVAVSLAGSGPLQAGAPTTFTLNLTNNLSSTLPAGVSVDFKVPSAGAAGADLSPQAAGDGWVCSMIATYGLDLVHCADGQPIAAGASADSLTLSLKIPASAAGATPVISYQVQSAAGGVLAGPLTLPIKINAPSPAALGMSFEGAQTLGSSPQGHVLALTNAGVGATTGPSQVTLALPAGVTATAASGSGWSCTLATASVSCAYADTLAGGSDAPPLTVELTGTTGAASPVSVKATASSTDAAGALTDHTSFALAQPAAGAADPVISFSPVTSSQTGTTTRSKYVVEVANQGAGASGTKPLELTEQLPAGVTATTTGNGWACSQHSVTLSCTYTPSGSATAVLATGATTPPLDVTLSGTADFSGGAVPVTTSVLLNSNDGTTRSSTSIGQVSVPLTTIEASSPAATLTADTQTVAAGDEIHATFGIRDLSANSNPVAVALVLPSTLTVPTLLNEISASPDESFPSPTTGDSTPITAGSGPGMTCEGGLTRTIVCVAPNGLAANSQITITVPVEVAASAMGTQTLTAGIVSVNSTTTSGALSEASAAVSAGGVSALGSPSPLALNVVAFIPVIGPDQTLPAETATTTDDGTALPISGAGCSTPAGAAGATGTTGTTPAPPTLCPTTVTLDASGTVGPGRPLTYGWVQTGGPTVTWSASAPDAKPGQGTSNLPSFPASERFASWTDPVDGAGNTPSKEVFTPPQTYGEKPTFTYPDATSLTAPTTFSFELYVTDGSTVQTASTTVTLDPAPPAPPVAPTLCMWDYTQDHSLTPADCLDVTGVTPAAGDVIIAGPQTTYSRDAAGDPLRYSWQVTQPGTLVRSFTTNGFGAAGNVSAPTTTLTFVPIHLTPVRATTVSVCTDQTYDCFKWPSGVAVLGLSATITNGRENAEMQPEQAVASISDGTSPAPLAVKIAAPAAAAAPGSTVELTASSTGSNATTYAWTQIDETTGTPVIASLVTPGSAADQAVLDFVAPSPTSTASTVTLQVTATDGVGAAASVGTSTVTVALLPAAPLTVTVTAAGGLSVDPGHTLPLQAVAAGGAGGPYSYAWSTHSGLGHFTPGGSTSTIANPAYDAPSGFTGAATLRLVVKDASGAAVSSTVSITVGSAPSFNSTGATGTTPSGPSACGVSGALASILQQVTAGKSAMLTLGSFTLSLGTPSGSTPTCSSWSANPTLTFATANVSVGQFTLSGVSVTLTPSSLTLNSGTISAPGSWDLGTASISTPITIPFNGTPSGAITWRDHLPWLAAGGLVKNAVTTLTVGASDPACPLPGVSATVMLHASATVAGANVNIDATVPLSASPTSFSACADVTGQNIHGQGSISVGGDGTITPAVTLTLTDFTPISGLTIHSATLNWDASGLTLNADTTVAGSLELKLNGSYEDSDDWAATATLAPGANSTLHGLPPGVSLNGATVVGSVSDQAGDVTFDVKLDTPNVWNFSAFNHQILTVNDLSAEISNAAPPTDCDSIVTQSGAIWVDLAGNATVSLPGSLPPVNVSADACIDPGSSAFVLTTSGFDGWTPFSGVPLTLNGLSVTVAVDGSGNVSVNASGQMTVDGVTAVGNLALSPDGGLTILGAIPDASSLGLPLPSGTSASVIVSSEDLDLGSAPASLFDNTGIKQSDLTGQTVGADSVDLLANFALPASLQCLLDQVEGDKPASGQTSLCTTNAQGQQVAPTNGPAPSSLVVSADIGGGVPTINASLSFGTNGLKLFDIGSAADSNEVSLTLQDADLQISLDGSFSIGGAASLELPSPSGGGEKTLPFSADVSLDLTGPTISMAASVGGCNAANVTGAAPNLLCNFLGLVPGLDIGNLSFQFGINFATTPIPTPTFGFAAAVEAIPCSWAQAIGDSEPCTAGVPDPSSLGTEPMSIAINADDTAPAFAFQIGSANGNPVLKFAGGALTVDEAELSINPSPAAVVIGAPPNAVTIQPGLTLAFDAKLLGTPVSVNATVNPDLLSVVGSASIGSLNLGPVTIEDAKFNLDIEPLAATPKLDVGFSGTVDLAGGTTLSASLDAGLSGGQPVFNFDAQETGEPVNLGGALTIDSLDLNGALTTTGGAGFDLAATVKATLPGATQETTLVGGATLSGDQGITQADLWANPSNFTLDGVSLTGPGCAGITAAPASLQTSTQGACIGASYGGGSFDVSVAATVTVNGIGVNIDGSVNQNEIDVTNASATVEDPLNLDPRGNPETVTIGSLSGALYLKSTTAVDPRTGQTVNVNPGDFQVSVSSAPLSLGGFTLDGASLEFGTLGGESFAQGSFGVDALGDSFTVAGDFSSDGHGNYSYDFSSNSQLVGLGGVQLAAATVDLSSSDGLTVSGSFNLGSVSSAMVKANLAMSNGSVVFSLTGGGSVDVLGTPVAGTQLTVSNEYDGNGAADPNADHPYAGSPYGSINVNGSWDNDVSFNGSATFGADGAVCISGSASALNIGGGTASYCGGVLSLSFKYLGFALTGTISSPNNWTVKTTVSPGHINYSGSVIFASGSVSAYWDFSFGVNSQTGVFLNVDPASYGTISGSTPVGSATGSVTFSGKPVKNNQYPPGTPTNLCATANLTATVAGNQVGLGTFEACDENGKIGFIQPFSF